MHDSDSVPEWRARRRTLQRFLSEHHGVIAKQELVALGFSDSSITRLMRGHWLVRARKGVYRGGSAPVTLESTLRTHLLRGKRTAGLTRLSAAYHLGYLAYPPKVPQIVIPGTSGFSRTADLERHCGSTLSPNDLIVHRGLRCTSPLSTVLHLALETPDDADERARRVFRRAIRGAASDDPALVPRLRAILDARAPFPGSRILNRELRGGLARTLVVRSSVEDRFVELCRRFALPIPATNVTVHGWELDTFWVKYGAYVELDTYGTHGDEVSFERDREKQAALAQRGIRGFAVTDRRIDHAPAEVAANVRGLLGLT